MNIEKIKKRYKDEWLLIKITKTDKQDRPIEGEVLLHSKNRDEIYEGQKNIKDYLYIAYSGEMPKKGFAVKAGNLLKENGVKNNDFIKEDRT